MTEATKTLVHALALSHLEYLNGFLAGLSSLFYLNCNLQSFAWPDFFFPFFFFFCVLYFILMKLCYVGHSCFIILTLHIPFKIFKQPLCYLKRFLIGSGDEAVVWGRGGAGGLVSWTDLRFVCHFSYCPDSYPKVSSKNRSWRAKPLHVICPLQQDATWYNPWKRSWTFQTCPQITVVLQQVLPSVWWNLQNTYWEIVLLVQIWCIFISGSTLLTKTFFVIDILNPIFPL